MAGHTFHSWTAEDGRRDTGPGHRPAGLPPPFDTGGPEGPLPDGGPSWLSVLRLLRIMRLLKEEGTGKSQMSRKSQPRIKLAGEVP